MSDADRLPPPGPVEYKIPESTVERPATTTPVRTTFPLWAALEPEMHDFLDNAPSVVVPAVPDVEMRELMAEALAPFLYAAYCEDWSRSRESKIVPWAEVDNAVYSEFMEDARVAVRYLEKMLDFNSTPGRIALEFEVQRAGFVQTRDGSAFPWTHPEQAEGGFSLLGAAAFALARARAASTLRVGTEEERERRPPPLAVWDEKDFVAACEAHGLAPGDPHMLAAYGWGFMRAAELLRSDRGEDETERRLAEYAAEGLQEAHAALDAAGVPPGSSQLTAADRIRLLASGGIVLAVRDSHALLDELGVPNPMMGLVKRIRLLDTQYARAFSETFNVALAALADVAPESWGKIVANRIRLLAKQRDKAWNRVALLELEQEVILDSERKALDARDGAAGRITELERLLASRSILAGESWTPEDAKRLEEIRKRDAWARTAATRAGIARKLADDDRVWLLARLEGSIPHREALCERCHVTPTEQWVPLCEACLPQCQEEWYPPVEDSVPAEKES